LGGIVAPVLDPAAAEHGRGKELRAVLRKWGPVSKGSMGLGVAFADAATVGEGVSSFAPASAAHKEITEIARETGLLLGLRG